MASTLTPSNFNITIKEEHVIKGVKTLNESKYTISNVTNVDRRIVTVPQTTSIDLINVNGVNPGAGTFPSSSIQYVRITNLDTTSSIAVSFTSSDNGNGPSYWIMSCPPTSSVMFSDSQVTGSDFSGSFDQNVETISIFALDKDVDLEYVVVNS
jgi:hypothetical protein